MPQMAAGTVRRRIRFFAWENLPESPDFDLGRAAQSVAALDNANWRYEAGDMTTAALVDGQPAGNDPAKLRFFRLREGDDVPHKMDIERATSPVEVAEGEAITDWTHVVIWPDGYAAHDPHRDAPTLARLEAYFRAKTNERVKFVSLFDRGLIERLRALEDLRAVELRIARPDALQDVQDQNLGMFEGIFNMARESESATLSTTISVGRSRTRHLNPELKEEVVALAEVASEFLDHLIVRGVDHGRSVQIDLLHQRIETYRSVRRASPRVRQPEPDLMYDTIAAVRRELDEDGALDAAARGRIG
jgi:hypothetical protein